MLSIQPMRNGPRRQVSEPNIVRTIKIRDRTPLVPPPIQITNPLVVAMDPIQYVAEVNRGSLFFPALYAKGYTVIENLCVGLSKEPVNTLYGCVKLANSPSSTPFTNVVCVKVSWKQAMIQNQNIDGTCPCSDDPRKDAAIGAIVNGHHNIIRLIDSFEDERCHYIVSEYVPGGDLFDLAIQPHYKLNEVQLLSITTQLVDAIMYLHEEKQIIHRDISIENILYNEKTKRLVVIDFGAALPVSLAGKVQMGDKVRFTKMTYTSDEAKYNPTWDAKANDCYAIGVVLLCLCFAAHHLDRPRCRAFFISGKWVTDQSQLLAHVSRPLREMINGLIQPEANRWTLQQVRECEWMKGERTEEEKEKSEEVQTAMEQ